MNDKLKNMIISVLVLCAIATSSGLILGFLNKLTYVDPNVEAMNKFNSYYKVDGVYEEKSLASDPDNLGKNIKKFAVGKKGKNDVFGILSKGKGGYGGDIELYIFIENDEIVKIEKGENKETLFDKQFDNLLKSFQNKALENIDKFEFTSNGANDVDIVSGATMTSNAVLSSVNNAITYYKAFTKGVEVFEKINGFTYTSKDSELEFTAFEKNKNILRISGTATFEYGIYKNTLTIKVYMDMTNNTITKHDSEVNGGAYNMNTNYVGLTFLEVENSSFDSDANTGATTSNISFRKYIKECVKIAKMDTLQNLFKGGNN